MPARKPPTRKDAAAAAAPSAPAQRRREADDARRDLVVRLRRIEGQLRGVQRMIEAGDACEPVAQQLAAARKALDRAFFELMACAIEHPSFSDQSTEHDTARVQRLARTLARLG